MSGRPDVKKGVILPADLWDQCEEHILSSETDFSKLCRTALRQYLDRLTVCQSDEVLAGGADHAN